MDAADVDLSAITDRLSVAGCVAPTDEALAMVGAASDAATLENWLTRREDGEPPAWIIGTTTFCGRTVRVDPGVYVPRAHSEELARRAAGALPAHGRAVDLCTGSGAVAFHLAVEVPTASVIGIDMDPRAAVCARRNGVVAVVGDLAAPIHGDGTVHVVTSVAPYVPSGDLRFLPADVQRHEPVVALDGGDDGLHVVRRVIAAAARLLRPGGLVLVEVGGEQDVSLAATFDAGGFGAIERWWDGDGDLRGVSARLGS